MDKTITETMIVAVVRNTDSTTAARIIADGTKMNGAIVEFIIKAAYEKGRRFTVAERTAELSKD